MLRSNVFESRRFLAVAQQALLAGARLRRRLAVPGDGNAQSATVRTESPESTSKSVRAVSSVATTAVAAVAPRLVLRHNEAEACQRVLVAYFKATRQHAEAVRFFTVCGARTLSRTHTRTHARTHALTYARTHSRTHSRTHAHTHALMRARARTYTYDCCSL